jgi:hypothetical protein
VLAVYVGFFYITRNTCLNCNTSPLISIGI